MQGNVIALTLVLLVGCQSLPDHSQVEPSSKLLEVAGTDLDDKFTPLVKQHGQLSGAYPLASGLDAMVARLVLVQAAEKTLDLQYYIWRPDTSGKVLAWALLEAAGRGVRVRLLLDDMGSPLGDEALLLLDQHPNIEVRLFNPIASRRWRLWSMLTDFGRVNRRMHNKSLTADNTVAIVGGRNIGNEYFASNDEVNFADLDLAVIGPVVDQVSSGFDLYWNHGVSYPVSLLTPSSNKEWDEQEVFAGARQYVESVRHSDFAERLALSNLATQQGLRQWYWGQANILYDHPDKALNTEVDESGLLSNKIAGLFDGLRSELLMVSPYFVPGEQGVAFFRALTSAGVKVTIVTNSLSATDVGAVHSGYAKYRKALLRAGVILYEMRAEPKRGNNPEKAPHTLGSSAQVSLHAKAFFLDRHTTFVGSMNLDPRSFLINTEIGVVLESPEFTAKSCDDILATLKDKAYRLTLDERGDIVWESWEQGVRREYHTEPQVSVWRRFGVWILGLFPIESQL